MALHSTIDKMSFGHNVTARKYDSDIIVRQTQRTSVCVLQCNVTEPDFGVGLLCRFIVSFFKT